ncbi:MAG: proprotein convertase P-domain-containing protein, partial [Lewinella sp.]|nr:proprotein convertase P-domain-containing protein [Lewinella sp.]
GDLTILLEAPDGSTLPLVSGPGANTETGCGDSSDLGSESGDYNPTSFSTISFSSNALTDAELMGSGTGGASIICDAESCEFFPNADGLDLGSTANFSGTQISSFEELYALGSGVNGAWTLYVHDGGGGDVGVVQDFEICITYTSPTEVCGISDHTDPLEIPNGTIADCSGGIPDLSDALAVPVDVSGIPMDAPIVDIQATLGLQHTRVGELSAVLAAPDGTAIVLFANPGSNTACGNMADFGEETGNFMPIAFDTITFLDSGTNDPELMGDGLMDMDRVCPGPPCDFFPNADGTDLSMTLNFMGTQAATFAELFPQSDALNGTWTLYLYDGDMAATEVGTLEFAEVCVSHGPVPQPPGVPVCYPSDNPDFIQIPDRPVGGCVAGIADLADAAVVTTVVDGIGSAQAVTDVSVSIDIQHTWVGDLTLLLQSPNGTTLPLVHKAGADTETGCGDSSDLGSESADYNPTSFSTITFSDSGSTDAELMGDGLGGTTIICDEGPCDFFPNADGLDLSTTLNFAGIQIASFADFYPQGDGLNGTWRLFAHDGGGGDVGTIEGFEVCITTATIPGQPPVAVCRNLTVNTDCMNTVLPEDFDGGSFDPDGDMLTFSLDDPGPYPPGVTMVTLTVADGTGGTDDCTATITVVDNTTPLIECADGLTLNFNGEDFFAMEDLEKQLVPVAFDGCGGDDLTFSYEPAYITCDQVGEVIDVEITICESADPASCTSCVVPVTVDGLPCGWMTWDDHIDCPGSSADYDAPTETFLLTSADCSHLPYSPASEEYAFVKTILCGDGEIIAQVTGLNGLGKAWAGVTMRESNDPGSKKFQVMTALDYLQHRVDWRHTTDGINQSQSYSRYGQHWLRIVRTGSIFQAFTSYNGVTWGVPVNTQVIPMNECLEVGLVVTNVPYATNVTASFNHVEVTPPYVPMSPRGESPETEATGVDQALSLQVFPNPTTGQFTLNLSAFLGQDAILEVMDINGQVIRRLSLGVIEHSTEQLDLFGQPAGIYVLRLRTEDGTTAVQRVILQPRP